MGRRRLMLDIHHSSGLKPILNIDLANRLRDRMNQIVEERNATNQDTPVDPPKKAYELVTSLLEIVDNDRENKIYSVRGNSSQSPPLGECAGCGHDLAKDDHRIEHVVKAHGQVVCDVAFHKECFVDPQKAKDERGHCPRCHKAFPNYERVRTEDLCELAHLYQQEFGVILESKLEDMRKVSARVISMFYEKLEGVEEFLAVQLDEADDFKRQRSVPELFVDMVTVIEEDLERDDHYLRQLASFKIFHEKHFDGVRQRLISGEWPTDLVMQLTRPLLQKRFSMIEETDIDLEARNIYNERVERVKENPQSFDVDSRVIELFCRLMKIHETERGVMV